MSEEGTRKSVPKYNVEMCPNFSLSQYGLILLLIFLFVNEDLKLSNLVCSISIYRISIFVFQTIFLSVNTDSKKSRRQFSRYSPPHPPPPFKNDNLGLLQIRNLHLRKRREKSFPTAKMFLVLKLQGFKVANLPFMDLVVFWGREPISLLLKIEL